jgi:hypothetical protein
MTAIRTSVLLAITVLAAGAGGTEEIQALLRNFNHTARKPDSQSFRKLFRSNATYRDPVRSVSGIDALVSIFTDDQIWSERTSPRLQDESIRLIGESAALVDARLVQYGSTMVKFSVPLVLLVEKDAGVWKISAVRAPAWPMMNTGSIPPGN